MSAVLNILIVEDNFSFSLEIEMLVKKLGYNIISTVDNSGDALVEILDRRPDLILMDIEIKGRLSGIEIAEKVGHLKIPIIFITSFANDEHFNQASRIENSTYIIKPVELFTLKAAINLLLKYTINPTYSGHHNELRVKEGALYLKKKNDFYRVDINDILYIESSRVYCKTVTIHDEEFLNRISLNDYYFLLKNPNFIKPHRSYLINSKHIEKVNLNENLIVLKTINIPISRKAKSDLKDFFKLIS